MSCTYLYLRWISLEHLTKISPTTHIGYPPEQQLLTLVLGTARAAPLDQLILVLMRKTLAASTTDAFVVVSLILFLVHV